MDDITPNVVHRKSAVEGTVGCSSVCCNQKNEVSEFPTSSFTGAGHSYAMFMPYHNINRKYKYIIKKGIKLINVKTRNLPTQPDQVQCSYDRCLYPSLVLNSILVLGSSISIYSGMRIKNGYVNFTVTVSVTFKQCFIWDQRPNSTLLVLTL
ncbi:uncharacterized protein LOC113473977 [Diaphorina citri]|uniref:Uncharacterized protein LOC113473977 n=1 Tax=Diaphorina citri TaxID=121845 RepID=A0A3Q0JQ02_DIACI|nr:uncharacterized protein LOC113473977 [Diaphorina citri]